jgi:hypothetical protein
LLKAVASALAEARPPLLEALASAPADAKPPLVNAAGISGGKATVAEGICVSLGTCSDKHDMSAKPYPMQACDSGYTIRL